jgi:RNA polymerase sigma-70 factor (ECF subfamily)
MRETPPETDAGLMERLRRQDAAAFETLFERYRELVRRRLLRVVPDPAAADDLLQEVFLRVWTRSEQWGGGELSHWLLRIAVNLALNHLRAVERRRELPLDPCGADSEDHAPPAWLVDRCALSPDEATLAAEGCDALLRLVDDLPPLKRDVVRLVADAGLAPHEVAELLGVPEGTVRSRLHHARKRLARDWRELTGGDEP